MKLTFSQIHNQEIFDTDFESLTEENGTIEFKRKGFAQAGMAVVYAPNGTGKSSFANVLKTETSEQNVFFTATDETGTEIRPESHAFSVIGDQISRNIIQGDESQYLVGREIRREYELRKNVEDGFYTAFHENLPTLYKTKYGISTMKSGLLDRMHEMNAVAWSYVRSIVNRQSRGKDIVRDEFVDFIRRQENRQETPGLEEDKIQFVISDYGKAKIVSEILKLDIETVVPSTDVPYIEQHEDAVGILKKYHSLPVCIVCDNHDFHGDELLERKQMHRQVLYDNLNENTKSLLEKIVKEKSLTISDPFGIRQIVLDFISGGDSASICELKTLLSRYVDGIVENMITDLTNCFNGTTVLSNYAELAILQEQEPQLDSEDLMFIRDVISENIDRDIRIVRDEENGRNFKLLLGEEPLLNVEREKMHLSTGEQNFISLAFELLLAKNSAYQYIILDDPISSFDSIYKNKIAFCIVKFLERKKQIVLTHNLDLVRLLDVQLKGCYNLYMLNNTEGGRNGFIRVSDKEQKLLINLSDLVMLFQNKDGRLIPAIRDRRKFLISMVPFMRGYVHICIDRQNYYSQLSNIMHGYGTETVDIARIYNYLFGEIFVGEENVCASDVLQINCSDLNFMDNSEYPLLAETLRQTLVYYVLRMKVEHELIDIFRINVGDQILTLNEIILRAFNCNNPDDPNYEGIRADKVFFTSRKTLLNEFNHFEGNMNIFQPAMDINAVRLEKEVEAIEDRLVQVRNRYAGE